MWIKKINKKNTFKYWFLYICYVHMQPDSIMTQWVHMSHMLPFLPDQTINELYPPATFPIEARHFLAEWIESQRWYETHADTRSCNYCNESLHVCRSQGRLYVGKCRAGIPGSDSVRPGLKHAADDGSAEFQRGGQDEADAAQQEDGTAAAAASKRMLSSLHLVLHICSATSDRVLAFTGCLSPASRVCSHGQEHPPEWKCHDQHGKFTLMQLKWDLVKSCFQQPDRRSELKLSSTWLSNQN